MALFFDSIWNESNVLVEVCKSLYCPKDDVKSDLSSLVEVHVCSRGNCKLVEQSDWLNVARAYKPCCLE